MWETMHWPFRRRSKGPLARIPILSCFRGTLSARLLLVLRPLLKISVCRLHSAMTFQSVSLRHRKDYLVTTALTAHTRVFTPK